MAIFDTKSFSFLKAITLNENIKTRKIFGFSNSLFFWREIFEIKVLFLEHKMELETTKEDGNLFIVHDENI